MFHRIAIACVLVSSPFTLAGADKPTLTTENFHDSLKPVGFVITEPGWHVWCCAPVRADNGKFHAFVARWSEKASFDPGWHTDSEIAHYTADKAEGPYTYVATILKGTGDKKSWRGAYIHNPNVVRLRDGRYAMTFISAPDGRIAHYNRAQKIGLMLADTPDGPWKLAGNDGMIFNVLEQPESWCFKSDCGAANPTLLPMPDGRYFLYFKSLIPEKGKPMRCQMGLAIADKVEGPYRAEPHPLAENKGNIEDGFAFLLNGEVNLLVTDCHGAGNGGGMIYRSKDGIHFGDKPVRAYEPLNAYVKPWPKAQHCWSAWVLQRPALLLGPDGIPTHLTTPCGTAPEGSRTTGVFLFKIDPPAAKDSSR